MAKYAKDTSVSVSQTKQQVEKLLTDWGIDEFFFGRSSRGDGLGFKYKDRMYKFNIPTPEQGYLSNVKYQQKIRQRWRIFYMTLKMKLEEIDGGGETFEDQFLSKMCLPDGSTVGDFMRLPENVTRLAETEMPKLLT